MLSSDSSGTRRYTAGRAYPGMLGEKVYMVVGTLVGMVGTPSSRP